MTPRTLRCANFHFYLGIVLLVLGACTYALLRPQSESWQAIAAVGGIIITLLWGGSYLALRYTVDAEGITRRTLAGTRRIRWAELTGARLEHKQTPGVEYKGIILQTPGATLRLGSDLLDPDDIDALLEDIRNAGIPLCAKDAEGCAPEK